MTAANPHVRRNAMPDKSSVSGALAIGWARASRGSKGAMADRIDCSIKTIDRALTGDTLPELHKALASLHHDESALDEVFLLYGLQRPRRLHSEAANDMHTIAGLSGFMAAFCTALSDGQRDHTETLELADMFRKLKPSMFALLEEADRIRGVAA